MTYAAARNTTVAVNVANMLLKMKNHCNAMRIAAPINAAIIKGAVIDPFKGPGGLVKGKPSIRKSSMLR